MSKRYGINYQGSKSQIAEKIIAALPSGERFVDLFGGGAAMTHAAIARSKQDCKDANDYCQTVSNETSVKNAAA